MHVYRSGTWSEGYLDETLRPGLVRVDVHRQIALDPVDDQYFVRPPDLAMLVTYVRMLGPRQVARKVVSRRQEGPRNDAWLSAGVGRADGRPVGFVLPTGPQGVERVVVPAALTFAAPEEVVRGPVLHFAPREGAPRWEGLDLALTQELKALAGWSIESGTEMELSEPARLALQRLIEGPPAAFVALADRPAASEVDERHDPPPPQPGTGRPRFHCFGYGHYAKTQVIPNLGRRLELDCVHEVDPLQLGPISRHDTVARDTAPCPRPDERIESAVVASYHHTHGPIAVALLDSGVRHVVIEKPVVTTTQQLDDLLAALQRHPDSKVHVAFQRRYSPFNQLIHQDLGGGPVSMSAAVYEVPLPARHWYRWPAAGNAVVANGCHWIDHFLHLNRYVDVVGLGATVLSSQLVLTIDLANGASASISLRHQGAPRRGVRDHCVFFDGEATATLEDLTRYSAESGFRRVRSRTDHPYRAIEEMYAEFGRRIVGDQPGDDLAGLRASTSAVLELARLVDEG